MSSKAKKRKVSMEPVLQDYTVTSFSDLHPDVPGPSDSSLFEKIKNYDVELPNSTFNQTSDTNLSSGPYPSDSSLDFLFKQTSNSETNAKAQRPFQKKSQKKQIEEGLFDSCLKDSFSDKSLEHVHKPFLRKKKNDVRHGMFDSDFELNASTKDSPFKKPFQRKSKSKKKANLFDSLVNDSQPNTPEQQPRRTFERKSRKKISSHFFDGALSSDSINQPSPVQNFITRRISRRKKNDERNLFDVDLSSSQSDVSMPVQSLKLKRSKPSNKIKNNTGFFDDLLENTDNESQNEKSSVLGSCSKHEEDNIDESSNLEYESLVSKEPEAEDEQRKENDVGRKSDAELPDERESTYEDTRNCEENEEKSELPDERDILECDDNSEDEDSIEPHEKDKSECADESENGDTIEPDEKDMSECADESENGDTIEPDEKDISECDDNSEDEDSIEPHEKDISKCADKSENGESKELETDGEGTRVSVDECESMSQLPDQKEEDNSEIIDSKDTETEGEGMRIYEDNDKESKFIADLPDPSKLTQHGEATELEENHEKNPNTSIACYPDQQISCSKNPKNDNKRNGALNGDSTNDAEAIEDNRQSNVGVAFDLNAIESTHISLEIRRSCRSVITLPREFSKISVEGMPICTPDVSFKDMPTSTPNVKGKTVSFFVKEDTSKSTIENYVHDMEMSNKSIKLVDSKKPLLKTHLSGGIENNFDNSGTFTRRKSSLRTHTGNIESRIVNNLTKDTSIHSTKRVSFKLDNKRMNNLKQLNVENSDEVEHSKENRPNNYSASFSLESLVYNEPSENETPDSESVYIDIHPSRGKSTSSSNTESFGTKKSVAEVSTSLDECQSSKSSDSHAVVTKDKSENENTNKYKNIYLSIDQTDHGNNNADDNASEDERTIVNTDIEEEPSDLGNKSNTFNKEVNETITEKESEGGEEEESEIEEEEEAGEELDSVDEEEEPEIGEKEEESEEEQTSVDEEDQETEEHCSKNTEYEEFDTGNHTTSPEPDEIVNAEQDENINPVIKFAGEYEFPFKAPKQKKQIRTSSLFKEKSLDVPSKSQLKAILNKIPFSEFKNRKKRKSSDHCVSREQMQQYEIEEELMRNQHQKKAHNKKTFVASNKLKRPKKWVTPKLYDFLISKLNPQFGIRSRVRAEELVLFLVEHVESIEKTEKLTREDVDEMKIELARLGIVKTHWDFFKFVDLYFHSSCKNKMYPLLPGVGPSAFEFGPSNVFENIMESINKCEVNSVQEERCILITME